MVLYGAGVEEVMVRIESAFLVGQLEATTGLVGSSGR